MRACEFARACILTFQTCVLQMELMSPERRPHARDLRGSQWELPLHHTHDWRTQTPDPIYVPEPYTPVSMRSGPPSSGAVPPWSSRKEHLNSNDSFETNASGLAKAHQDHARVMDECADVNSKAALPTKERSAALFDAALLSLNGGLGENFTPMSPHLGAYGEQAPPGSSVVVQLGHSSAAGNDRDEMEARMAGLSQSEVLEMKRQTPQKKDSKQIAAAAKRSAAPPPPLLGSARPLTEIEPWRIDYASSRFVTPYQIQQQRVEQQRAAMAGQESSHFGPPSQPNLMRSSAGQRTYGDGYTWAVTGALAHQVRHSPSRYVSSQPATPLHAKTVPASNYLHHYHGQQHQPASSDLGPCPDPRALRLSGVAQSVTGMRTPGGTRDHDPRAQARPYPQWENQYSSLQFQTELRVSSGAEAFSGAHGRTSEWQMWSTKAYQNGSHSVEERGLMRREQSFPMYLEAQQFPHGNRAGSVVVLS